MQHRSWPQYFNGLPLPEYLAAHIELFSGIVAPSATRDPIHNIVDLLKPFL
jgi:hypothetical protein